MTKKFWNDWKRRIGETEQVYLKWDYSYDKRLRYSKKLLDLWTGEKILSVTFNKDTVNLLIERKDYVRDYSTKGYHYDARNESVNIHRKDIISISFRKNNINN